MQKYLKSSIIVGWNMKQIRCSACGKLLLEMSFGHIKKKCPHCKAVNEIKIREKEAIVF